MSVVNYYDEQAAHYDASRFSNSYGRYIDWAERSVLNAWLKAIDARAVIDLGCGTGRFLNYAMTGLDGSAKMLQVAAAKFPDRHLIQVDITRIPCDLPEFDAGICFHVLMHLDHAIIGQLMASASKVIRPGGTLIVDCMSAPRRNLWHRQKAGWHGNTAFDIPGIADIALPHWKVRQWRAIVLIPIHRMPSFLRPWLAKIDLLLCRSFLGRYASYYIVQLERVQ